MNFSSLIGGFVFGTVGFWMIREGKRKSRIDLAVIGFVLCIYPFFIDNPWLVWGLGSGLIAWTYRIW